MAGEQMIEVPPTSVIRHWVAWTYGKGCPEEYVDFDPMRIKQFDRWLAEVKAQAWEEGYSTGLIEYANKVTFNPYGYAQHPYRQGEGSENSNSQPTAETLAYLNRQGETNA